MNNRKTSKDLTNDELDHFIALKIMGWRRGSFEETGVRKSVRIVFKEDGFEWCDKETTHYIVDGGAGGFDTNEIWSPSTNLNHTHIAELKFLFGEQNPITFEICDEYLVKLLTKIDCWAVCSSARNRSEALYEVFLERNPK